MLSDDDVQEAFERRAERYRRVPGLVQKIYVRFRETGEFGAIYVWETEESLREFRERERPRPHDCDRRPGRDRAECRACRCLPDRGRERQPRERFVALVRGVAGQALVEAEDRRR